jgi:hypothetical protein
MAYSAFERGGAAAGASVSVPRRSKDEFEIDDAPSRTGDTAHPPGPEVAEITSRNAAAPPPASDDDDDDDGSPTAVRDSSPGKAPPRITRPGAGAPRPRATQEGPPPPLPASGGKKGRLNLPAARGARSKVPAPKSQKPKIPAKAGAPTRPKAPTPPPRDLLDTNEFIGEETVACHACGSFISKRAEICLYCGAPTGFVIKDRGSKP